MDDASLPSHASASASAPAPLEGSAVPSTSLSSSREFSFDNLLSWIQRNPVDFLLTLGSFLAVFGFYFFYEAFHANIYSALTWIWSAWNAENDFEHGRFSPLIIGVLIWLLRDKLWAAPKEFSPWGVPVLAAGLVLYLLSVRMLQPRVAIVALPIILTGLALIIWGRHVAKLLLFPFFFLYIMVPIPQLEQMTASLQLVISHIVATFAGIFGLQVEAIGSTLHAAGSDGFTFEIAGGCSGVRSLMAMTMITALYVYFTQDKLWKQVVIFGASLGFAVLGNIARVVSIILIAKLGFKDWATGSYHDNASLVLFFPFALLAMVGFAKLLNLDWPAIFSKLTAREQRPEPEPAAASPGAPTRPGGTPREEDKY